MKTDKKIVTLEELKKEVNEHRKKKETIAFTNGCFDILHLGHVSYLEKAKGKNRVLIVGLNSDASVRKIKGEGRPINNQQARAKVLAALVYVDFVVIFDEETPLKLIEAVKPDVLIKGADWKKEDVVGASVVGKVELVPYLASYSTSGTIALIKKNG
ncbi:MAG TPA: adenylyltransferase/cytidyltransferase family protein [Candidatus Omnitrophota bacterium]|nr:adenylyltransferase/cytidyltransferase family protein [Candidatus Omnitrophota bacterium]